MVADGASFEEQLAAELVDEEQSDVVEYGNRVLILDEELSVLQSMAHVVFDACEVDYSYWVGATVAGLLGLRGPNFEARVHDDVVLACDDQKNYPY
jgi:hypothetical protein